MASSVGNLSAQGMSSAAPVTSAAFVLTSPTPSSPKNSVRCGSFEFTPRAEASHLILSELRRNMDTTFGGVHFIVDSRGFLRLPKSDASSLRTSAPEIIVPPIASVGLPANSNGSSRRIFGSREEQRKRRRDLRHEEEERAASRLRQCDKGCYSAQSSKNDSGTPYLSATEQLVALCYLHSYINPKDNIENATHLLKERRQFLDIQKLCEELRFDSEAKARSAEGRAAAYNYSQQQQYVPDEDIYIPTEVYPASRGQVNMIQKTRFSKREAKKFSREIKFSEVAMAAVPDYIDWSDQNILFSKVDHPIAVPRPGHAALVLEAQIGGYNMSKVFVDGVSGINLLFASTMKAMGLTVDMLK